VSWGIGNTTPEVLHPVTIPGLTGVTAVASGSFFTLARRAAGTLAGWGDNNFGRLADATAARFTDQPVALPGMSGVTDVSAGGVHVLAIASSPAAGPAGPTGYRLTQTPMPFPDHAAPLFPESDRVQALSAFSVDEAWALLNRNINASEPLHRHGQRWTPSACAAPASGAAVFTGVFDVGQGDPWAVGTDLWPTA
jgi:hypothetical protein